jgi:hypothetical protein
MVLQQCAGDACCPLALGRPSNRPDLICHELLMKAPIVLLAFAADEMRQVDWQWWLKTYSNTVEWPLSKQGWPQESFKLCGYFRRWVLEGILRPRVS